MEATELETGLENPLGQAYVEPGSPEERVSSRMDPGRIIEFFVRPTSLGTALVGVTGQGVCAVLLGDNRESLEADLASRFPGRRLHEGEEPGSWAVSALAFVEGRNDADARLALDLKGTDFQKAVWSALREIPPGCTTTYSQIAARIGRPTSVRAVARACGANPLAVVVPCHRVLRGDGSISGYRWGVERKRLLLDREAAGRRSHAEAGQLDPEPEGRPV